MEPPPSTIPEPATPEPPKKSGQGVERKPYKQQPPRSGISEIVELLIIIVLPVLVILFILSMIWALIWGLIFGFDPPKNQPASTKPASTNACTNLGWQIYTNDSRSRDAYIKECQRTFR